MSTPSQPAEQEIPITLVEKHWVVVLGLLEDHIQTRSLPAIKEMRSKGTDPNTLAPETITVLAAPIFVRGIIVKELVARGVMKQEADDKLGIDQLMGRVEKYYSEKPQKNS
jgi:hypothetical protein